MESRAKAGPSALRQGNRRESNLHFENGAGIGPLPGETTIRKMADFFGQDPDVLLAMADQVAADVKTIIIKNPAYARFIRENAHLTKEQWEMLTKSHSFIHQERA
jgi:hypothetical protein